MLIRSIVAINLFFLVALVPTSVLADGLAAVEGNLFSRCRGGSSAKERCGFLKTKWVVHKGTPGTKECQQKCVLFPFLSSSYDCGACGPIQAPPAAPVPAPAPKAPVVADPAPKAPVAVAPNTAPSKPLVGLDVAACDPATSILAFTGHNEAHSKNRASVNVTWNPAFAYDILTDKLIWCGDFTYTLLVTPGEFNFSNVNRTATELIRFAEQADNNIEVYNTPNTSWVQNGLTPGATYSILVLAQTQRGHVSYNREPAVVEVSTTDPKLNADFKRMIVNPEPTNDTFTILDKKDEQVVVFSGLLPNEVTSLVPQDHMYFFDSDGNATLARCLSIVPSGAGTIAWKYKASDLGDVFDELDISVDVVNREQDDNANPFDAPLDPQEEAQLDLEIANLHPSNKKHLCMMAYPGREPFDCFAASNDPRARRLFFGALIKAVVKAVKKVAKAVVKAVVDTVKKVVKAIDNAIPELDKTVTLFNIDDGGTVTCTSVSQFGQAKIEAGIGFDALARARIKIKLSLLTLVKRASIDLTGGFGITTYVFLAGREEFKFQPDPLSLFKISQHYVIPVVPVPVWITNRQSLSGFLGAVAVVETQGLVTTLYGYDYKFHFSFDRDRSKPFQTSSKLTKRKSPEDEPAFDLRISAEAEVGITLAWDTLVFSLLQASIVADLGLRSELAVSTNVEAIVVTAPYFLVLEKFYIDAFIRLRLLLGLNNDVAKIIKKITNPNQLGCKFVRGKLKIPKLPPPSSKSFQAAIDQAKNNSTLSNATEIDYATFNKDGYSGKLSKRLDGNKLDVGFEFVLFSEDFRLLGTPEITVKEKSAQFCVGTDAAIITYTTSLKKAPINFLNDLKAGLWFTNFDGALLKEDDTGWIASGSKTDFNSFTVRLPRSVASSSDFAGYRTRKGASVILRATPELMPLPKHNMFAKIPIRNITIQCCDNNDCSNGSNGAGACVQGVCVGPKVPTRPPTKAPQQLRAPTTAPRVPTKAPQLLRAPTKAPRVPTKAPRAPTPAPLIIPRV